MRTISIINLKGGVAKTTSSINIAYILAEKGYKVLLLDNDAQGDCSRGLNRRTAEGDGTNRIMLDRKPDMDELILKTDYPNLDIITSNLKLSNARDEVIKDQIRPQQTRIRKALKLIADRYDFCVIDNEPKIDTEAINAMAAADDILLPIEIDDNTLEGMKIVMERIEEVQEEHNPDLENVKCFITKFQRGNEAHKQGAVIVEKRYPTMKTRVRFSPVVARSTFMRIPVTSYSPNSAAARDYKRLVDEYLRMIGE